MSDLKEEKIYLTAYDMLIMHDFSDDKLFNLTTIADKHQVSRAWIYKNFGSQRSEIIKTAIDIIFPMLIKRINPVAAWKVGSEEWRQCFVESLEMTLSQVEKYPELFKFFLIARLRNDDIAKHLRELEKKFAMEIVRPEVEVKAKKSYQQNYDIAETMVAFRIGLISKWIASPQDGSVHRAQIQRIGLGFEGLI